MPMAHPVRAARAHPRVASAHAAAALTDCSSTLASACRGTGNGATSTLETRVRSDLHRAVGSLAQWHEQPRLAGDVEAHPLHQRRGGPASLPACSGVQARMLTAGGPAHCSSLASARLLRLPTAVRECSCFLTQPLPFCSPPPALLSLSRLLPALATRLSSPAAGGDGRPC